MLLSIRLFGGRGYMHILCLNKYMKKLTVIMAASLYIVPISMLSVIALIGFRPQEGAELFQLGKNHYYSPISQVLLA